MKLILAVVLSLVAFAVADNCDVLQRIRISRQWRKAYGTGSHRLDLGLKIFKHLFDNHPNARALFADHNSDNVYSHEFQAYAGRITNEFDIVISLLDEPVALKAQVNHLKAKLTKKHITPEQLTVFGKNTLEVLPEYIGNHFDQSAWTDCLKRLKAALVTDAAAPEAPPAGEHLPKEA
jgi:hemoglobin-like flavoprotein